MNVVAPPKSLAKSQHRGPLDWRLLVGWLQPMA